MQVHKCPRGETPGLSPKGCDTASHDPGISDTEVKELTYERIDE